MVVGGHSPNYGGATNSKWSIQVDMFDADDGDYQNNSSFEYNNSQYKYYRAEHILSNGNGTYLMEFTEEGFTVDPLMMFHDDGTMQWSINYWTTDMTYSGPVFLVLDMVYHPHGYVGLIFMVQHEHEDVFGLASIDMSGNLQWTRMYNVDTLSDLIATRSGQFMALGYTDTNNLLISAGQYGRYGCEIDIDLWSYDAEGIRASPNPSVDTSNSSLFTVDTVSCIEPTISQDSCCWIAYEEFEHRHVWHCYTASLVDLNYDVDNGYSYQWYEADGETPISAGTNHYLDIDPAALSLELPYKGERVVKIIDGNGCKGEDVARFYIIDPTQTVDTSGVGVEDQYCSKSTALYAPPISLRPVSINIGKYDSPMPPVDDVGEDINQWSSFTSIGTTNIVNRVFTDPISTCGPITQEYAFDLLSSCNCTKTAITFGSWYDEWANKIFGIVNPQGKIRQ